MIGLDTDKSGIAAGCFFGSRRISVGSGSFVNYKCFFDGSSRITIGQNCNIGYEVMFATSTHQWGSSERRAGRAISSPIVVSEGVWVGARVTILGGVTIGKGAVIASGSIVTTDCEADSLYAGTPARKIRQL